MLGLVDGEQRPVRSHNEKPQEAELRRAPVVTCPGRCGPCGRGDAARSGDVLSGRFHASKRMRISE